MDRCMPCLNKPKDGVDPTETGREHFKTVCAISECFLRMKPSCLWKLVKSQEVREQVHFAQG